MAPPGRSPFFLVQHVYLTIGQGFAPLSPERSYIQLHVVHSRSDPELHGVIDPDPLRPDPTLQHLEAKANRLMIVAAREGCLCVNLSRKRRSRLTFPRLAAGDLTGPDVRTLENQLSGLQGRFDGTAVAAAEAREIEADCIVETGDYWRHSERIDAIALSEIDRYWLAAASDVAL